MNWQKETLANDLVKLVPLKEEHFEVLFNVASDPLIWDQHPDKERYKRNVFQKFFIGALETESAFLIMNAETDEVIGSTRYYDYEPTESKTKIGYTFFARKYWGGPINRATKELMINHAFQYIDNVVFQVGSENFRSQKAVLKLGAHEIHPVELDIAGSQSKHVQFLILKENWIQ